VVKFGSARESVGNVRRAFTVKNFQNEFEGKGEIRGYIVKPNSMSATYRFLSGKVAKGDVVMIVILALPSA
jgi:hypothetical protein